MTRLAQPASSARLAGLVVGALGAAVLVGAGPAAAATAAPVVTSMSRHTGSRLGGQLVEIYGRNLSGVTSVSFGPHAAPRIRHFSASHVEARTPASGSALYNVRVRSAGGLSAVGTQTHFRFGAPPQVFDVAPTSATTAGGSAAFVSGYDLKPATAVTFGASTAKITFRGTNGVALVVPAHAAGVVPVKVTTPYGTDSTTFRYGRANTTAWGKTTLVDPVAGEPLEISCSTNLCAFGDRNGGLFTQHAAESGWTVGAKSGASGITWGPVDCPTDTFCTTLGGGADGDYETHFDGTSWSTPVHVAGDPYSIFCTGPTYCRAVSALAILGWDGSTWKITAHTSQLVLPVAFTCVPNVRCTAVDQSGTRYTYASGKWTKGAALRTGSEVPSAGDCSSAICAVTYRSGATYTLDTGATSPAWTAAANSPFAVTSIACAADTSCTGIDGLGHAATLSGGTWSASVAAGRGKADAVIGCRSGASCEIADENGYVTELQNDTGSTPTDVDPTRGGDAVDVSCAGGLCALLDATGNVLTRSGTGPWSDPVKLDQAGLDVSCASSSWCVATSFTRTYVYDGSTWQPVGGAGRAYYGLSCPAVGYCIGASGKSVYRFDGTSWTGVFTFAHTIDDISCSSVGHCVAVSQANVQARLTGTTWTKLPAAPMVAGSSGSGALSRIACPTDTRCLLVHSDGAVAQLDGSTWKLTPNVIDGTADIACASATRCIVTAITQQSTMQFTTSSATFDGTSWSAPARLGGPYFVSDSGPAVVTASSPTTWLASVAGYVVESH